MSKKLTTEDFTKRAKEVHGDRYNYSKTEYNRTHDKVIIDCKEHGKFLQTPNNHLRGKGCAKCAGIDKLTTKEAQKNLNKICKGRIKTDASQYKNSNTKNIKCECLVKSCGYKWESNYSSLITGTGCAKCAGVYKLTTKEFIKRAKESHGDIYNYSETRYINSLTKVFISCKKHGEFTTQPHNHLRGYGGCPICGVTQKKTTEDFVKKAIEKHGNKYDYSETNYKTTSIKVSIYCKEHGEFKQTPNCHLSGSGCPKCIGRDMTVKDFIEKSTEIHNNKYDYSKVEHAESHKKITIICKEHGEFKQRRIVHLKGHGCPGCNSGWTIEIIRNFLKELIDIIPTMTQTEWYHILRSRGILNIDFTSKGYNFVNLLTQKDDLDFTELQNFIDGEPSRYEDAMETGDVELLANENDTDEIEAFINNEEENELSTLNVRDIFRTLDRTSDRPYIDNETAEALIGESLWKMIQVVCEDEKQVKEIKKTKSKRYSKEAQQRFLNLYNIAKKYKLPKDYDFRIDGKLVKPNLMQRLTIALLGEKKSLLNLSGTGAGKTLSASLFARDIKSNLTVVICPNDVIDGWVRTIKGSSPNANIFINKFSPKISSDRENYIIFNVEKFQQSNSEDQTKKLLKNKIDFIILDEIQLMKNREGTTRSTRNINVHKLVSNARKDNDNFHILGMTATPIINELSEGVSLLELVMGQQYPEISNRVTIDNCLALRGHFVSSGIRWMPQYKQKLNIETIDIDCSEALDTVKEIKRNPLLMEQIFVDKKMDSIADDIKPGCVIYAHYKNGIIEPIRKKLKSLGLSCEPYTGDQNSDLRREILKGFIDGDIDVLIATSPISTGVDGLQYVCNNLFVISLPWTSSSLWQLIGRFWRQGQKKKQVNVTIPLSYLNVPSEDGGEKEWSWCKYRYSIVKSKQSLSDIAVDGVVPKKCHISHSKALKAVYDWLDRIEGGDVKSFKRRKISVELSESTMKRRRKKHGDFTDINREICGSNSSTIHKSFTEDSSKYETYHNEYKRFREKWNFDHINEIIIPYMNELPDDAVIGDFGSGPLVELANSTNKEVFSFDHVETNDVTSVDLAYMPEEYHGSLDVAIFSLSLMGNNLTDYIREAHKCLKKNGQLLVVELSSRISSLKKIESDFKELGYKNVKCELIDRFISISAKKSSKVPNNKLKLKLGRVIK